ncbi:hypothetical protein E2562_032568 [Oryza meyeriana var. granulata]|uniref:Uncharacterized protein n=1 Tax=Oryza meyeriana var. granulata TaxID=110450 RepID=A0A6G1CXE5_9ORYZ|nr:hypothetical protein E2562_032568 [Oryza meyeriana var. granulata]
MAATTTTTPTASATTATPSPPHQAKASGEGIVPLLPRKLDVGTTPKKALVVVFKGIADMAN